jgi:hypothetical protein
MAERPLELRVLRRDVWELRSARWGGELLLLLTSIAMLGAWAVTPGPQGWAMLLAAPVIVMFWARRRRTMGRFVFDGERHAIHGNGRSYPYTSVRALRIETDVTASKAAQRGPSPPHWLVVDVGEDDLRVLRGSVAQLEPVRAELSVLLGLLEPHAG